MGRVALPPDESVLEQRVDLLLNVLPRNPTFSSHAWDRRGPTYQQNIEQSPCGWADPNLRMKRVRPAFCRLKEGFSVLEEVFRRHDKDIVYLTLYCQSQGIKKAKFALDPPPFRANFGVPLRGSAGIPPIDH